MTLGVAEIRMPRMVKRKLEVVLGWHIEVIFLCLGCISSKIGTTAFGEFGYFVF
jgi:hypothetical protein